MHDTTNETAGAVCAPGHDPAAHWCTPTVCKAADNDRFVRDLYDGISAHHLRTNTPAPVALADAIRADALTSHQYDPTPERRPPEVGMSGRLFGLPITITT